MIPPWFTPTVDTPWPCQIDAPLIDTSLIDIPLGSSLIDIPLIDTPLQAAIEDALMFTVLMLSLGDNIGTSTHPLIVNEKVGYGHTNPRLLTTLLTHPIHTPSHRQREGGIWTDQPSNTPTC